MNFKFLVSQQILPNPIIIIIIIIISIQNVVQKLDTGIDKGLSSNEVHKRLSFG
ncbi:hypothetical protein K8354_12535 [Polaribacter litorisediminis]|uniref:hypothetical protein n=1 Tax=Polaribacter litorisediminis TaxID=1908341 RepID=UPI001CBFE16B|nr:hypothetical protein [Polaribacter litorisediminis]UAM97142.1 hypothetical protein K8354_12535 [Polaribacter litorisediminis]